MTHSRPILFSAPMVRAIIEGTKTQTRRIVKPQPVIVPDHFPTDGVQRGVFQIPVKGQPGTYDCLGKVNFVQRFCPYGKPGDRLWVRETFFLSESAPFADGKTNPFPIYRADFDPSADQPWSWRPSIFMPRWASRITLEVIGVRVERLCQITEADAIVEGCKARPSGTWWQGYREFDGQQIHETHRGEAPPEWMIEPKRMKDTPHLDRSAKDEYRVLWGTINGDDSWVANPWVWVVEFRRVP